ncbi:MAG: sigma-54 dependent transcriptional regulator [Bacteroidetes bacterium]|nr:sigma-54 dependent transcriptional regulator [Bacteroidota bacterium]
MDKIIIIDDDESIRTTLVNYLSKHNYKTFAADNGLKGLEIIKKERPDLVITDIRMPVMNGFELLLEIQSLTINTNVIMMTAFDDMQSTVKAIQQGAYDYIEKPIDLERLKHSIKMALENKYLTEKLEIVEESKEPVEVDIRNNLVGKSHKMRDIYKKIAQVSTNRVTALVQGESGTGKELVARAIHFSGITKEYPFIPVNCTALTETLLESELFGHVKGAFTGSIKDKKGKFELAGEGSIFLDEISEISIPLQVKLLRILQEKEFERVGGEATIPMKARIITATNKNLEKLVSEGKFREDLYYRLNVVVFDVPPLRDRRDDIPLLVSHFLKKINKELHKNISSISVEIMNMLNENIWEGNIRELENVLLQAAVLSKGDVIEKDNILLKENFIKEKDEEDITLVSLSIMENRHIEKMLDAVKWDKPKAAKCLGISLPTLYSKIELYKITRD